MPGFIKFLIFIGAFTAGQWMPETESLMPETESMSVTSMFRQSCDEVMRSGELPLGADFTASDSAQFAALCLSYRSTLDEIESTPLLGRVGTMLGEALLGHRHLPPPDYLVGDAIEGGTCSTHVVRGLSLQLIDEIECMRPGLLRSVEDLPGMEFEEAAFPFLQAPAAEALTALVRARHEGRDGESLSMRVTSALRTLPQQYILYHWYRNRRCGIRLASRPGHSHHEHGLAVDIGNYGQWRRSFEGGGFDWAGRRDPWHFKYVSELERPETVDIEEHLTAFLSGEPRGPVDMRELSTLAFQRLWNRNHPDDPLEEDGVYDRETARRIAKAPARGFSIGAQCPWVMARNLRERYSFDWFAVFTSNFEEVIDSSKAEAAAAPGDATSDEG